MRFDMSVSEDMKVEFNGQELANGVKLPHRPAPGSVTVKLGDNVFVPRMPSDPLREPSAEERTVLG